MHIKDEDSVHEINSLIFSRGMRKLNSVNFLMQTDDSTKQAIFDSVCEQRIQVELQTFPGSMKIYVKAAYLPHRLKLTYLI